MESKYIKLSKYYKKIAKIEKQQIRIRKMAEILATDESQSVSTTMKVIDLGEKRKQESKEKEESSAGMFTMLIGAYRNTPDAGIDNEFNYTNSEALLMLNLQYQILEKNRLNLIRHLESN